MRDADGKLLTLTGVTLVARLRGLRIVCCIDQISTKRLRIGLRHDVRETCHTKWPQRALEHDRLEGVICRQGCRPPEIWKQPATEDVTSCAMAVVEPLA